MTYGQLLKALANESGQSMAAIARKSCVAVGYIWAMSSGQCMPPPACTRERIIAALGPATHRGSGGRVWTREDLHYLAADERRNCAGCDERKWCEAAKSG